MSKQRKKNKHITKEKNLQIDALRQSRPRDVRPRSTTFGDDKQSRNKRMRRDAKKFCREAVSE